MMMRSFIFSATILQVLLLLFARRQQPFAAAQLDTQDLALADPNQIENLAQTSPPVNRIQDRRCAPVVQNHADAIEQRIRSGDGNGGGPVRLTWKRYILDDVGSQLQESEEQQQQVDDECDDHVRAYVRVLHVGFDNGWITAADVRGNHEQAYNLGCLNCGSYLFFFSFCLSRMSPHLRFSGSALWNRVFELQQGQCPSSGVHQFGMLQSICGSGWTMLSVFRSTGLQAWMRW
ncbi:uncharacterized protein SEPMUDRAFT_107391 [Sphaerulina musiva SO2202]|uniref:Uncharacterized protein n=1 Tax=Sphaerulina musiva (strain SO2202) TaxID=692275 RepID=M3D5C9_SPHMS|nr:uncharacterized protein SEPMUDRAFT_107391 [Sphaerulina musiva SO2202]EMF13370.1 hypothetical protein SEPMUDRAFT_107391 [Sphaerulina musiva SO2202]